MEISFGVIISQKTITTADEAPELLSALVPEIPAVVREVVDDMALLRLEPFADGFSRRISAIRKKCLNSFLSVVELI